MIVLAPDHTMVVLVPEPIEAVLDTSHMSIKAVVALDPTKEPTLTEQIIIIIGRPWTEYWKQQLQISSKQVYPT